MPGFFCDAIDVIASRQDEFDTETLEEAIKVIEKNGSTVFMNRALHYFKALYGKENTALALVKSAALAKQALAEISRRNNVKKTQVLQNLIANSQKSYY